MAKCPDERYQAHLSPLFSSKAITKTKIRSVKLDSQTRQSFWEESSTEKHKKVLDIGVGSEGGQYHLQLNYTEPLVI